jgi:glutathione S-transferase
MLKFFELAPSPNNLKVRMALRRKGIEFETVQVDPFDRAEVLEVSGQELTPAIADRGIVLHDSEAILHYLDANYPETDRLFPSTRDGRKACDTWKERIDRDVGGRWLPIFRAVLKVRDGFTPDERQAFEDALRALDEELGDRETFVEGAPVCDLRVAVWASYALPSPAQIERVRLFRIFRDQYGIAPGSLPRLERVIAPWIDLLG